MTIAEDLKQSVKALVCHEMDIVHEGDWFKEFVKDIVDERLNEIQGSEYEDKYFLVRWGEGYSTKRPAVYEVKEIIEGEDWQLPCDFIDSLIEAMPCEKLKFTDLSGDVYFHCLGDGKDNRGGLAAGIGYGRS